ncbi:MAG: isoleucine--tRNA ligase [Candidatus Aenigmarchaeota archaeon]|nr:isoleucine--tRNA ligase [Candidatus Aenigmarchaeota archaeon]
MVDLREIDKQISKYWKENNIPEKVIKSREGNKRFFFLDGPPYASGSIHVGTALNKILKDFYIRYYRMKGFNVWCQPGYDCHGMPIENKVQKELGLKTKQEIEKIGIEKFIKKCYEWATKYIDVMSNEFNNLGVWFDWKHPYLTLDQEYMNGAWYTFKVAFEKGLLYKGIYPIHICPKCETAVAYNEIIYKNVKDTSIYVKFKIKDSEYLVVWTTTPWTLLANTGVMVHPKFDYAYIKVDNETWIIAKELIDNLMQKIGKEYQIIKIVKGSELNGIKYESPFKELPLQKNIEPKVINSAQYVTLETGTGLVHTAPGHGLEDYRAGRENGLAVLSPVNMEGKYKEEAGKYAGRFVKDADQDIIEELKNKGLFVYSEKISHEYPHCWRCESPLLFISVPQWFFKISKIRDKLIEENKKVRWSPDWAGKRFDNWLHSLDDWPISRQRYWGIPLPIWECEKCNKIKVLGSSDELPEKIEDIHRPYIDKIELQCECGGKMKRTPDILDVWFDSGVCSWASLGYPKKKELFEEMWPADLILEGSDQIRGWWNSQMITGVITFNQTPFKNVVYHGFVLEAHGKSKLSKSKGGISPAEFSEKYGLDVLRYFYLDMDSSIDINFNWDKIAEESRILTTLMNVVKFIETYCKKTDLNNLKSEDKWILSRINSIIPEIDSKIEQMKHYEAVNILENFILNDFSRSYVKYIRNRSSEVGGVLYYVLEKLIKLLAPVTPFLTEYIYQKFFKQKESIHLEDWPEPDNSLIDKELEKQMKIIQDIVEASNFARQENKIKLKYILPKLTISGNENVRIAVENLKELLKSIANVKEIEFSDEKINYSVKINYKVAGKKFGKNIKEIEKLLEKEDANKLFGKEKIKLGEFELDKEDLIFSAKEGEGKEFDGGKIILNTNVTDELKKEWLLREMIRAIQDKRKQLGLNVNDKVTVYLDDVFKDSKEIIEKATGSNVEFKKGEDVLEFEGKKYYYGVVK